MTPALLPAAALVQAGDPTWPGLLLLALLAGLLALDETALAQTWFSVPLSAGVITGLVCGDPVAGLAVALPLQIALAGNLPVGQSYTGDPGTAVVAVVGAAVFAGRAPQPILTGGIAADLPWLGWLVLTAGLLSLAGHPLIQAERKAHVLWMLEGHRTLRDGLLSRIERIHARCLLATFLRGAVFCTLFIVILLRLWFPLFDVLPERIAAALGLLPLLVPALGLGGLVERYGLRGAWPWVAGGVAVSLLVAVGI